MKILLTCGGTAGHINPAVALARMFQERMEDSQVLFVGAKGGMEERLVPKEGFPLETVTISSFWRSLSPSSLRHNLRTLRNLSVSKKEAARILDGFQPDLVVGTGGYASYPVVHEAARRGNPTAVHESNAVPGLTTQRLAKVADRVMVGYEDSRQHYHHPDRVVVTGTPVRGEFFRLTHLGIIRYVAGSGYYYFSLVLNIIGLVLGFLMLLQPALAFLSMGFVIGAYLILLGIDSLVLAFSNVGYKW